MNIHALDESELTKQIKKSQGAAGIAPNNTATASLFSYPANAAIRHGNPGGIRYYSRPAWRARASQASGRAPEGAREGTRASPAGTTNVPSGDRRARGAKRRGIRAIRGTCFL